MARVSSSLVQLSALAIWLGAASFFATAVAPALFAALPTRTLAGEVVGRLLPAIFYSGIVVGVLVIALQLPGQGGWRWRGRETAGLVIIASCAIAQLIVGPRIERLRAAIGVPIESLDTSDPRRIAFGRLHGASVAWLGLAMLAAVVAMVLSARSVHSRS